MKVVRQWMIGTDRSGMPFLGTLLLCAFLVPLSSCNPTKIEGKTALSNSSTNGDGSLDGKAYVYRDSPYFIAGPRYSLSRVDIASVTDMTTPELITTNTQLNKNCSMNFFYGTFQSEIQNCIRSLSTHENLQSLPRKADNTWMFTPGSAEFYQVNQLYHLNVAIDTFFKKLQFAYDRVNSYPQSIPRSIPPYLKDSQMFWFKGVTNIDNQLFRNGYVNAFANCNLEHNSHFSAAGPELCFGFSNTYKNFFMVQDPSVVTHETAHALVSVMMNMRNGTATSTHALRSNLGYYGYRESGAINEGIADYYSYIINRRTHWGEWAVGKLMNQSRPLTESDPIHIDGIDVTSEGRLSYPQYLHYDPNFPDVIIEDVHYAGQITSHYLVALTEAMKSKCTFTSSDKHDEATSYVLMLLAETLSELGDLNAKGIDNYWMGSPFNSSIYFTNLDPTSSYLWAHHLNQPTYRRFFQVFAKNINKHITGTAVTGEGLCPALTKNDSEKLLDDYGLLLFKTYNDNGNSTKDRNVTYANAVASIPAQSLTSVNDNNRRKSVLVSKELIKMAEKTEATPNATPFYIIDGRTEMESLLKDLLFKGFPVPLSSNVASVEYNNGNVTMSPGEIVAIIPNLHNASNSAMAGVYLTATDWDHVHITDENTGNFKPCVLDTLTTVDDGGEDSQTCLPANGYPDKDYNRLIQNSVTKKFPTNAVAPACFVLLEEGESGRWVSQNEFRKKQGLSLVDKDCLGFKTSGTTDTDFTFNPHECLVRFLPGANDAFYSKIDPQKNYYESVVKISEGKSFSAANIVIMEINKWVPPGTKFRCRLRANFSNCTDCYHDSANSNDDFIDAEYNGHKPFKVINFDFTIND